MRTVARTGGRGYRPVEVVEVRVWGRRVGAVALDSKSGFYVFVYEPRFARSGIELSPLRMPLDAAQTPHVFSDLPEKTYRRLPALLADSLPDDFGNALIDRYLAEKGVARESVSPLDRLAYMGRRAAGALEFKPALGPRAHTPTALDLDALVVAARKAVRGSFTDGDHARDALASLIAVGTSAGGARAKAVIAWNESTKELLSGQADAPDGFEHWLLKFDGMNEDRELGVGKGYGRIEYAYHLMARRAGIRMSECRLLEENGRAHFMTRRFDREKGGIKHHLQTLCALDHLDYRMKSAHGYEQLFMALEKLKARRADQVEAFRRMTFNVMARNCDDHTKNVSFLLRQGGAWELAPAYDVSFAHNPDGEWTDQHQMSVNGRNTDIGAKDLLAVADRFVIGEARSIMKEVAASVREWPRFAKEAGVGKTETDKIQRLLSPLD